MGFCLVMNVVPLREVYSRPTVPVSKDEVPKQEDVDRWPHLRGFVYLTELNSQVDLLIGSDVPEALQPKELGNKWPNRKKTKICPFCLLPHQVY